MKRQILFLIISAFLLLTSTGYSQSWEAVVLNYFRQNQELARENGMANYSAALANFNWQRYTSVHGELATVRGGDWDKASSQLDGALQDAGKVLNEIWTGNQKPMAEAPHWSALGNSPFGYPSLDDIKLQGLADFFLAMSAKAVHEKNGDLALTSLENLLTFANRIAGKNASMPSRIAALSIEQQALEAMSELLRHNKLTAEQCQRLYDYLAAYQHSPLKENLKLNRETAVFYLEQILKDQKIQKQFLGSLEPEVLQRVQAAGMRSDVILGGINQLFTVHDQSLNGTMEDYLNAITSVNSNALHPMVSRLAGEMDIFNKDRTNELYVETMINLVAVGSLVRKHRLETRVWPKEITNLVPDEHRRIDPHTKKPLIYQSTIYGIIISLGADMKDADKKIFYKPEMQIQTEGNIVLVLDE